MKDVQSKAVVLCVQYASRVGTVTAWPDDITDATIKRARKNGYLTTSVTSWHLHPAGNLRWSSITDIISPKGRLFLREVFKSKRDPR